MFSKKEPLVARRIFYIPSSYISNDKKQFEVIVKDFSNKPQDGYKKLLDLIKDYLEAEGIKATVEGLYNYLFEKYDRFFTAKFKIKDILENNNLHVQIL